MWNHRLSQIPPPQQQSQQQPAMQQMQAQPMVQYHQAPAQAQPASSDVIRTLWIGDLQFWMDETFLQNCFQATGELVSAKVIRNKLTSQSEGYGFIEFATHAAAEHVLQTYNGHMMPTAEQTFRLNWAAAGERCGDDGPDYTMFVGDLAADVTDYLLQETFKSQYPSVKGAKIFTDRTIGCSKGYEFVRFGDLDEQTRTMTEMDGVYCSSRPIRVGPATTKKNMGAQPPTKDVQFLSISGSVGTNIKARADKKVRSWWNGPCLFEVLDTIEVPQRDPKGPLRMPIIDKYKDMGTVVMGKIESGSIREGDSLLVMPNKAHVKVLGIQCDENKVRRAGPGENVRVKLSGIDDDDILSGFVLSCVASPIGGVLEFEAQLRILELLDDAIFTAGYEAVLHIHAIVEECEIVDLLEKIDLKKKKDADPKKRRRKPLFVKNGAVVKCRIQVKNLICIENFSDFAQLGRFTLCTEGKTIAVGKVVGLPPSGNARFA